VGVEHGGCDGLGVVTGGRWRERGADEWGGFEPEEVFLFSILLLLLFGMGGCGWRPGLGCWREGGLLEESRREQDLGSRLFGVRL